MTYIHTRGPNIDPRESVVSAAIPGGCCRKRSFFRCAINAPDLIEDDATNHFSMWEGGQVHLRG